MTKTKKIMKRIAMILLALMLAGTAQTVMAQNAGEKLFDIIYDINKHGDYAYAQKVMQDHGFTLTKKETGNTDYNYYYASPDGDTLNIGDQGAVGFGILASFSTEQIGRQAKECAISRGFSCEPDSNIYSDQHHCFLWIFDNSGMWIYGREEE